MKVFTASGELCFPYAISASWCYYSAAQADVAIQGPGSRVDDRGPEIDGLCLNFRTLSFLLFFITFEAHLMMPFALIYAI